MVLVSRCPSVSILYEAISGGSRCILVSVLVSVSVPVQIGRRAVCWVR